MSDRPVLDIALALRGDAERLAVLANGLRGTNLGPGMKDVGEAARLLVSAARKVEAADAARRALS